MNYFSFTATETLDWTRQRLVYVKAPSVKAAYILLENAHYADWRLTDKPSAYSHLMTDELGFSVDDPEIN